MSLQPGSSFLSLRVKLLLKDCRHPDIQALLIILHEVEDIRPLVFVTEPYDPTITLGIPVYSPNQYQG